MPKKNYRRKKISKDKQQDRKINRLVKMVTPEVKVFSKWSGTTNNLSTATNAMLQTILCDPDRGTTGTQRIGDEIKVVGIKFKLYVTARLNSALFLTPFRYVIYHDRQYMGTHLTYDQLILNGSVTDQSFLTMGSPFNHDNVNVRGVSKKKSVDILADGVLTIGGLNFTNSVVSEQVKVVSKNLRFKVPKQVSFMSELNKQGQIVLALFPGVSTDVNNNALYAWHATSYFIDN